MVVSVGSRFSSLAARLLICAVGAALFVGFLGCGQAVATSTPVAAKPAATVSTPAQLQAPTSAPASTATAKPKDKITFRLPFLPFGYDAPWFVAVDKGFFAENGIDAEVKDGQGSVSALQLAATEDNSFTVLGATVVPTGIAQGMPIISIARVWGLGESSVLVLGELGVKTPKDLEGKKMGWTAGSGMELIWPAFVAANGIDNSKIQVISVDAASKTPLLVAKKYDFTATHMAAKARIEAQGVKITALSWNDYGVPLLGHHIITKKSTIEKNPDLVRRVVTALMKSLDYSIKNPGEAVASEKKMRPELPAPAVLKDELTVMFPTLDSKNTKGKPLGWQSRDDWQNTLDILLKYGVLDKKVDTDSVFTNDSLPK